MKFITIKNKAYLIRNKELTILNKYKNDYSQMKKNTNKYTPKERKTITAKFSFIISEIQKSKPTFTIHSKIE